MSRLGAKPPIAEIQMVLDYLTEDERHDYLARTAEDRDGHIYESLESIEGWLLDAHGSGDSPPSFLPSTPAVCLIQTELLPTVREPGPTLLGPSDAARILSELIGRKDREHFMVLHLSQAHQVVAAETVSVGTLSETTVHPREIFKAAILSNSAAIICGHNHPSGTPTPSAEDRKVCQKLMDASELLGIPLLDFLIVHGNTHYSFQEKGELPRRCG